MKMCEIPDISDLDQETLKVLFEEGAAFIFLDVPIDSEFGVDMQAWNTAEKFKGIKMIPPGIHFIHYSVRDSCGEIGPRSGFFYNFKKQEVVVRKWNKTAEDIDSVAISKEEIDRIKNNLKNLDKYLAPYPYQIYPRWIKLSNHLNENLIAKLTPESGIIRAAVDLVACKDSDRPRGIAESENEPSTSQCMNQNRPLNRRSLKIYDVGHKDYLLPDLKPVDGTDIRFTKFPEKHYPEGATPAQITQHSMDYSYLLQCMVNCHDKPLDILGEIQFAFICFLVGTNLDSFEQWKELVGLLCSCDKAIIKHRIIYDNFTELLEPQLSEIPPDFLVDIVSSNNFIYVKLKSLFRFIFESDIDGRLKSKVSRFKQRIAQAYNWDLNDKNEESDEDLPVVVDLNDSTYSSETINDQNVKENNTI